MSKDSKRYEVAIYRKERGNRIHIKYTDTHREALESAAKLYAAFKADGKPLFSACTYAHGSIGSRHQATITESNYRYLLPRVEKQSSRQGAYGLGVVVGAGGLQ